MEKRSIGRNLVYERKLKGYTQEELSERTEVTVRTIQRIEKDEVNPHLQTVKLLAAALSINVDDLIMLENPREEAIQKKWLLLMHGTPLLGFVLPFCNVLFPLFLWIHKREDNVIYDRHGIKVLNFQITVLLFYILSIVAFLTIEKWGFLMFISIVPLCTLIVIANIIYAVKQHKCYYPLAIPFLRFKMQNSPKILLLLLLGVGTISCIKTPNNNIIRLDGTKISKDSLTRKIDLLMENANVTGLAISIFNNNEVIYQEAFGYKNADTKDSLSVNSIFYGASLSKAVFAILIMQLAEEGKIDLDTPLQDYLDRPLSEIDFNRSWRGYQDLKGDKRYEKITARMCLSHTTGFPNWRYLTKTGFDIDGHLHFQSAPGTRYSYSGEGFSLLQFVVEKIEDKGLEEIAQERVFKPLAMDRTSYIYTLQNVYENQYAFGHDKDQNVIPFDQADEAGAAGSLCTTLMDYSKFIEAVLEKQLLKKVYLDEMFTQQIDIKSKQQFGPDAFVDTDENQDINLGYGLGWGLLESPYGLGAFKEGHAQGFQHYSILFPEVGIGVIIMSNSDNAEGIFKELLEYAIADKYTPWEWENYIPHRKR
ncbi:serine hydrolase [Arenibacter algicola]|uniref:D-alanyl-D-alanine carboxypeptidase n=1 Tax=Arenibacter algicola TaxID=616991 RepID=A0A221UYT3_9FLAO|nr:serine hydrolase [Arenibacter algicola]ASO06420.1 D-alanyl-D-alanine carboxypeptidase [Arenibacter algicola]